MKKGKFTFAAKNQTKLQIQKFKKAVTKDINTKELIFNADFASVRRWSQTFVRPDDVETTIIFL